MENKPLTREEMANIMMSNFATLKRTMTRDLINRKDESVIYRKYTKDDILRLLEYPQRNAKELSDISNFLYIVSSHYRRLIDYYAKLPTYNYYVYPSNIPDKIKLKQYKEDYKKTIQWADKCNLKQECIKICISNYICGVFYGLTYESSDSFYIRPFNPKYADITGIEDGCFTFKINMDYFVGRTEFLPEYGQEFVRAYKLYKGDKETGIKGDAKYKWFEPTNGFCVKLDESAMSEPVPPYLGLMLSVLDIEDYKMLKKAKKEIDNYKVLTMNMDVDENGVPTMDYELAMKYYAQAAGNIPDGIGLVLSPFKMDDFSFQSSSTADSDAARESEEDFWFGAGTSPLLFGSSKATTSSALELSIKPDEAISFSILHQIERNFNRLIKKMNMDYLFAIKFLDQSIFNETQIQDSYFKGASYGVAGAKIKYASSLGMTPNEVDNMSYLEDKVLGLTEKNWNKPLVSANVQSGKEKDSTAGTSGSTNGGGNPGNDNSSDSTEQNEE